MSGADVGSTVSQWLERHTDRAPARLRERVRWYADDLPSGETADGLAAAACEALQRVLRHSGDRSVALDLLAADGLITLALLARAQSDPASLAAFSRQLLADECGRS